MLRLALPIFGSSAHFFVVFVAAAVSLNRSDRSKKATLCAIDELKNDETYRQHLALIHLKTPI